MNWVMLHWMSSKRAVHPPVFSWIAALTEGLHSPLLPWPSGTVTGVLSLSFSSSSSHLLVWISSAGSLSILFLFLHTSSAPVIFVTYIVSPILGMTCFAAIHTQDIGTDPLVFSSGSCPALTKKRKKRQVVCVPVFYFIQAPDSSWGPERSEKHSYSDSYSLLFLRTTDSGENYVLFQTSTMSFSTSDAKPQTKDYFSDSRRFDGDISLLRVLLLAILTVVSLDTTVPHIYS